MATLLHIAVSPREEASHSRKIGRDLACMPLPHPDRHFVEASLMPETDRGRTQIDALTLSDSKRAAESPVNSVGWRLQSVERIEVTGWDG